MATRQLLAELADRWAAAGHGVVQMTSVGGVDAARRVQADEAFDLVILAADAIDLLAAAGKTRPGSRVDLVHSGVAVAVPAGAPLPDLSSEAAVRAAVLAAPSLSCSTGPSGVALAQLFERWGLSEVLQDRLVTPPPGVPVGSLVAAGTVALGFQQLSELIHVAGLQVAGPLPPAIQIHTTFSGAVCRAAHEPEAAAAFLRFLADPQNADAKHRQGMAPA